MEDRRDMQFHAETGARSSRKCCRWSRSTIAEQTWPWKGVQATDPQALWLHQGQTRNDERLHRQEGAGPRPRTGRAAQYSARLRQHIFGRLASSPSRRHSADMTDGQDGPDLFLRARVYSVGSVNFPDRGTAPQLRRGLPPAVGLQPQLHVDQHLLQLQRLLQQAPRLVDGKSPHPRSTGDIRPIRIVEGVG